MKIAILAWGSLYWDLGDLSIIDKWNNDGVILPIEFSRISDNGKGRLTLVIDEINGSQVKTYWSTSSFSNLKNSIKNLRDREGTNDKNIGYINITDNSSYSKFSESLIKRIKDWANLNKLDAVIWTDLESNFDKFTNMKFSIENGLEYINNLDKKTKEKAIEYINKAPEQTITDLRKRYNTVYNKM
ncbi:hypothetical protein [Tenacibaculum finnmarkense]|uniref:hypothetical protein n=1 Tax=Tenacibaculum finnmarkense TaxID=2781243 RepID=UPI00187B6806|nr:hypothetical protein [Tenacibaculum finnmarkense]MBE7646738.1 hypothetical protein [Tenacibaculum finnmarkense genomovar ulcerans]MCG8751545.1 hypothetical protein [Tenacibaculum finnmarkense]MCG8763533.1 hypothetical protein [Tenacibaculum finnmarkense]MCG8770598.1 hypothetical protein [Tenacibaculum finnmarkense]MCG8775630.1 hypothetical protein [Tenacibaculum finnmarkense]